MKDAMDALTWALNKIEEPGAEMLDFGISAAQYHAGIDKLWKALRLTGVQNKDVFSLCAERIQKLESIVEKIQETLAAAGIVREK